MNKLLIFFFIVAFISSVFTEDSCLFALDDELIVNAEDQSEDKLSSIATLSDTIHTVMVWRSSNDEDGYNIKIAILKTSDTDSGAVPEHVYGPIKLETSHDYNTYPDVTALEDNEFIVTFSAGTSDEDLDIYAIGYSYTTDDKFETLSNEYMINTETDDNQEYPTARMVHDSSNTEQKKVLFVWSSKNQDPVQSGVVASYGVYAQLYDVTDVENFQSLGAELRINDEIPNSQFKQHMWAHTTDGSVVVVWESANQDGFASGVYGRVIECTGDLADFKSDEFQVNGNNLYNQYQIAVAGSRQEGSYQVVFTWASKHAAQSYYEIFQRPMDLDPTKYVDNKPIFLSNDTLVSQNSDSNSYDMEDPMITFTQQSNYVVIGWTSENQDYGLNSLTKKYEYSDGVYFRIFDLIDWDSTGLKDINEETAIHSELSFDQSEVKMDYFGTSDDIIFSWSSGSGLQKSEVKTRLWGFGGIAPTSNYDMVDQTLQSGIVHTYVTDDVIFEDQNGDDLIFNLYKAGTTDAIEDWIDFSVSADDKFIFVFTTPTSCDDVIEIEVEASNACGGSIRKPLQLTITNDSPTVPKSVLGQSVQGLNTYTYEILNTEYYDTEDVSVTISTPDLPSFLGYDQATNIISGTAPDGCSADGENSFDITIEAFDTCSQSSSVTFTVDITNEDPTYDGNMEAQSVKAGSSEEYDISGFFSDPEDGTLTFTFEYQSLSGTGPTWNKLDSTTGIFDWDVPDSQKAASYTIIVTAKDDCGKSNSGSFGLTIVNQAPQATASYEEENIDAGSSWTKLIEIGAIVDPEGATITYSAEAKSGEQWWAFNSVSRTFSGTAPDVCSEPYEIRLIGTDPSGQTANIEFSVKVGNNQYPTVIGTIDTISAVENHDFTHTFDLESLFADENYGTLTFSVTNEDDSTLDSLFYTYPDTIYNKPMPIYCGSSISYKLWATDECGQSTSITFMVQSTNSGPEIQDTLEDETFSISTSNTYYDIMSNDITSFTDPNNEDLEFSYYYIEDNGDKILVNWITLQESGDRIYLDLNLEGLCSETHTLEVNATDKCKNSVIQTFEINIVNDEPIVDPSNLLAGSTYTWEKNQEFSHIIGNPFIDDESDDELTFVLNQVVDGTLEDLPYIMSFEQETFTLKWNTYDLSDICDEVFHLRYTVSDRCGQSASVDFYVDFQTKQPIIIDGGIQDDTVSTEQVTYRVEYGKKFNDEDQETLTFDIYLLDDTNEEETIDNYHWITNIVEKENYQERYMDLNLNEQCDDVHNFIVYAKDGCNMQVRETFAITVVNNDPYIIDGASLKNGLYTGYYGQEFTLELGNVFADDDDDSVLTLTNLNSDDGSLPYYLNWDNTTFTLQANELMNSCEETYTLEYKLTDRCEQSVSHQLTLNFINQEPELIGQGVPDYTTEASKITMTIDYGQFFNDPDDSELNWEILKLNKSGDTVTNETIDETYWITDMNDEETYDKYYLDVTLSEQCDGVHYFHITVNDGCNEALVDEFSLTITNDAPTYNEGVLENQIIFSDEILNYQIPSNAFVDDIDTSFAYSFTVTNADVLEETDYNWISLDATTGDTFVGSVPELCDVEIEIEVTAEDSCTHTATGSFKITIKDTEAPIPSDEDIETQFVAPGEYFEMTLLNEWFVDPEQRELTLTVECIDETCNYPEWLSYDPESQLLSGTVPDDVCSETWCLQIVAEDPCHNKGYKPFSIHSHNNVPQVEIPLEDQNALYGNYFEYTFDEKTFDDYEGNTLTYSAIRLTQNTEELPDWLSFNPDTRTFSGTVPEFRCKRHVIELRVFADDGCSGQEAYSDFMIIIKNAAPELINELEDQEEHGNHWFVFQIPPQTFADPDNDEVKYHLTIADMQEPNIPDWLEFDETTGIMQGITPDVCSRTYHFIVSGYDQCGDSNDATFALNIVDPEPYVKNPLGSMWLESGDPWTYQIPEESIVDPLNDELTFTAQLYVPDQSPEQPLQLLAEDDNQESDENVEPTPESTLLPSWLEFDPQTRTFTGEPDCNGVYEIEIIATDKCGNQARDIFTLSVSDCEQHSPDYMTDILTWCSALGLLSQFFCGNF